MQLSVSKQRIAPNKELSAKRLKDAPKRHSISEYKFKKLKPPHKTLNAVTDYQRVKKFDNTVDTLNDRDI